MGLPVSFPSTVLSQTSFMTGILFKKIPSKSRDKKFEVVATAQQRKRQKAQPDRNHVRTSKGLAVRRHALRPKPQGLPFGHRSRRNRDLLVMFPEPSYESVSEYWKIAIALTIIKTTRAAAEVHNTIHKSVHPSP
jgi:hypothetical protein